MDNSPEIHVIEGRQAFAQSAIAVVKAARLKLSIVTQRLERPVYGSPEFVEAIKTLALSNQQVEIRILARNAASAVRESVGLIELARRLSDRISLHQPSRPEAAMFEMDLLIADEHAFVERNSPDSRMAEYGPDAALAARGWLKKFEGLWHESEPSREMRTLRL